MKEYDLHSVFYSGTELSCYATQYSFQLSSTALRNLNVIGNDSLYQFLNRTVTPMGARLLRSWLTRPLIEHISIMHRHEAIQELASIDLSAILTAMKRLGDAEKQLLKCSYGRITPASLNIFLRACKRVCRSFCSVRLVKSELLHEIFTNVLTADSHLNWVDQLNGDSAEKNDYIHLWKDDGLQDLREVLAKNGGFLGGKSRI